MPLRGIKVTSRLCGENLLENTVMVYVPGCSPSVLKSNSFTPFLWSQWNLFPSSLSRRGGKTTLPLVSIVERERRAVLSRMGVPALARQNPLGNNRNDTSISCPTVYVWPSIGGDTQQYLSFSVRGSSRATTLERPGSFPPMVGSEGAGSK